MSADLAVADSVIKMLLEKHPMEQGAFVAASLLLAAVTVVSGTAPDKEAKAKALEALDKLWTDILAAEGRK